MQRYTVPSVTGVPYTFRNGATVLATVDSIDPVMCFNAIEEDDTQEKKPRKTQWLCFETQIRTSSQGFRYCDRALAMRFSAKDATGVDVAINPNELNSVIFILCGDKSREQPVLCKCRDLSADGAASRIVEVHVSFFHDPSRWMAC